MERRHMTCRSSNRSLVRPVNVPMRPKNKERNLTVRNWLFAQSTHVVWSKYRLHGWWSSGSSYKFQVSSTSAERLPSCDCQGSKFGWSHYLGQWLIQQPYSHKAVMGTCKNAGHTGMIKRLSCYRWTVQRSVLGSLVKNTTQREKLRLKRLAINEWPWRSVTQGHQKHRYLDGYIPLPNSFYWLYFKVTTSNLALFSRDWLHFCSDTSFTFNATIKIYLFSSNFRCSWQDFNWNRASRTWAEEVGGQEGPGPPSIPLGGHPCYWPLLENAKSASSLATHLGHDWKLLKLLPPNVRF